jgi:hypothetical protein
MSVWFHSCISGSNSLNLASNEDIAASAAMIFSSNTRFLFSEDRTGNIVIVIFYVASQKQSNPFM